MKHVERFKAYLVVKNLVESGAKVIARKRENMGFCPFPTRALGANINNSRRTKHFSNRNDKISG
jgi:hypothetical protein